MSLPLPLNISLKVKVKVTHSCPTLCDPMDYTGVGSLSFLQGIFPTQESNWGLMSIAGDSLPSEPQGKPKNTGVSSLCLPQHIFPTQESNWGLLYCRWILYQLSYQGSQHVSGLQCILS